MDETLKAQRRKELELKKQKLLEMKKKNQKTATETDPASPVKVSNTTTGSASPSFDSIMASVGDLIPEKTQDEEEKIDKNEQIVTEILPIQKKREVVLTLHSNHCVVDIPPPIETPTYQKPAQTKNSFLKSIKKIEEEPENVEADDSKNPVFDSGDSDSENENEENEENKIIQLTDFEKNQIIEKENFLKFFFRGSKFIERALNIENHYNITLDYAKNTDKEMVSGGSFGLIKSNSGGSSNVLFSSTYCRFRSVTDIGYSQAFSDLIVVSYSPNPNLNSSNDDQESSDGLVLGWSLSNVLDRPEFIFTCQSGVERIAVSSFNSFIIGGTYCGQIVIWDRSSQISSVSDSGINSKNSNFLKTTPIVKTSLNNINHTNPLYSLQIIGTKNAHNLVSISTDGKMAVWQTNALQKPTEVLELSYKPENSEKGEKSSESSSSLVNSGPITVTASSFQTDSVNFLIVGSEDGSLYLCDRHSVSGDSQNGSLTKKFKHEHTALISAISFHPAKGAIDFSDLFLSSSIDWTAKLWNIKQNCSLYTFNSVGDYVYDICWSPVHPSIFCMGDGTGNLTLWNLNEDPEVPAHTVLVGAHSVNRICWLPNGKKIIVGDSEGKSYIFDASNELVNPTNDDWYKLEQNLLNHANASPADA